MPTDKMLPESSGTAPDLGPTETFGTRDFYLACYLRSIGYDLLDLKHEGRRRVFVFPDKIGRRDAVIAFYGNRTTVQPLAFSRVIRDMKALLHNA